MPYWHTIEAGNTAVQLEWSNKANKRIREADMPFGIQPIHIIIIVAVGLLIFGPARLPELGRSLGKGLTEFRRGTREMTEGFREELVKSGDGHNPAAQPAMQPQAAAPIAGSFCIQCGTSNLAAARFCHKCGTPLSAGVEQSS
jgi:sec-independent protein translocase protein TatA